jgi:hypothetical protein
MKLVPSLISLILMIILILEQLLEIHWHKEASDAKIYTRQLNLAIAYKNG